MKYLGNAINKVWINTYIRESASLHFIVNRNYFARILQLIGTNDILFTMCSTNQRWLFFPSSSEITRLNF